MKIKSQDISVVVQGPVDKENTSKCLESIRKHFPNAEIILSTWKGTDVSGLDYDKIVLSEDPGTFKYTRSTGDITDNNMNRQLVSIQAGLNLVTHKYTLKLRTDLFVTNNKFVNYFNKFHCRHKEYQLFKHRILSPSVFSKLYSTINHIPVLFHPSDWWYFGLTEDLTRLFSDTICMKNKEFYNCTYVNPNKNPYPKCSCKMFPEQYYFFSALKRKFPDINWVDWTDITDKNIRQSEISMVNNFTFLNFYQHGIYSLKHPRVMIENDVYKPKMKGLISYKRYSRLYRKYCNKFYYNPLEDMMYRLNKYIPLVRWSIK